MTTRRPRQSEPVMCRWCGRPVASAPIGRPRAYCRRSCRQRAYESRRRGIELGLGDEELVIARHERDDALDRLAEVHGLWADAVRDAQDGLAESTVLSRLLDGIDRVIGTNG
ncbi:MAG: hypothetical protein IPG46_11045 [Actinobacteria bacterium]|nr:hypothetical protein [Actinomycetota bacterium]